MTAGWQWDFEDDRAPGGVSAPAPPTEPADDAVPVADTVPVAGGASPAGAQLSPPAHDGTLPRRRQLRRRRGGVVLVLIVLAAVVLSLSGSRHRAASPSRTSGGARAGGGGPLAAPQSPSNENTVVSATLAYTPFIKEGTRAVRDVALTFDDGPGPYTPGVLEVLEREHVRATFFAIGKMQRYFGESTSRELRDGDVVGDHTQGHLALARLPARDQREQILEGMARVELLSGSRPRLFRPPYGSFNAITMRQLHAMGLLMVLWSVDTGDYLQPGVAAILQRTLEGVHPGGIVLLHDGGGTRAQTIAALPLIIHALRARGYRLVTVPQLLADDPPPRGLPLPASLAGD